MFLLKRTCKLSMIFLVIIAIGVCFSMVNSVYAGIEDIWGKSAICNISTKNLTLGFKSKDKQKYYFGKSRKRIFSPSSPDSYGKDSGTVYTLDKPTCATHQFTYKDNGRTVYGNTRDCGEFEIKSNSVVLALNSRQDNGLGNILTSADIIHIRQERSTKLVVSGSSRVTNSAETAYSATTNLKLVGSCELIAHRDIKMKTHTKSQQIQCCVEYSTRMCNGGVISLSSNECTNAYVHRQCKRLVGDGGIYCND